MLIQDELLLFCSELNRALPTIIKTNSKQYNSTIHVNLLSSFLKLFTILVVRILSDLNTRATRSCFKYDKTLLLMF